MAIHVEHTYDRERGQRLDGELHEAMAAGRPVCVSSRWCQGSGRGMAQQIPSQ